MFPSFLYEYCKHYHGYDTSFKPRRCYCKAFPDGDGIPSDYVCLNTTDFDVFDGNAEQPRSCSYNCSFESKYHFVDPRVQAEIDRKNGLNFPDE